jgi:hypothetical protein
VLAEPCARCAAAPERILRSDLAAEADGKQLRHRPRNKFSKVEERTFESDEETLAYKAPPRTDADTRMVANNRVCRMGISDRAKEKLPNWVRRRASVTLLTATRSQAYRSRRDSVKRFAMAPITSRRVTPIHAMPALH